MLLYEKGGEKANEWEEGVEGFLLLPYFSLRGRFLLKKARGFLLFPSGWVWQALVIPLFQPEEELFAETW